SYQPSANANNFGLRIVAVPPSNVETKVDPHASGGGLAKLGALGAGIATLAYSNLSEASIGAATDSSNLLQWGLGTLVLGGVFSKIAEWFRSRSDSKQKSPLALPPASEEIDLTFNPYREVEGLVVDQPSKSLSRIEDRAALYEQKVSIWKSFRAWIHEGPERYFLKKDQKVNGILLPKGSQVDLDSAGRVRHVLLSRPFEMGGVLFHGSVWISHGDLLGRLADSQWIQGRHYLENSEIELERSGVMAYTPSKNIELEGIRVPQGVTVKFWENGNLRIVPVADAQEIQGIKVPAYSVLYFEEWGGLKRDFSPWFRQPPPKASYNWNWHFIPSLRYRWSEDLVLPENSPGHYRSDGELGYFQLSQDWEYGGRLYRAGSKIEIRDYADIPRSEIILVEGQYEEVSQEPPEGFRTVHHAL
ncbi:MAG: hypothetical protein K8R69_12550, partial [Deltaproteobacteria bacterium]|nr:hypothetical protein [Deltaproteobacteria bacterium]